MNEVLFEDFAMVKELYNDCRDLVKQVILFGSVAEGTQNAKSDVDILFVAKKSQGTNLGYQLKRNCRSRGWIIGRDICVEELQGYNLFPPTARHRLHLLKTEESVLNSTEPIIESVKRGKDITKGLNA